MKDFDLRKYLAENKLLKEEEFVFPMEFQLKEDVNYESFGVHGGILYKGAYVKDRIESTYDEALYVNVEAEHEARLDKDDIRNLRRLGATLFYRKGFDESVNESIMSTLQNLYKKAKKMFMLGPQFVAPTIDQFDNAERYIDYNFGEGHSVLAMAIDRVENEAHIAVGEDGTDDTEQLTIPLKDLLDI
tara:strand:- start:141 stop:704 length:564 start_codon:yes stop_codon:yes gene_type:complete